MGYMNLERIHVFPCILVRKIRDSENKNGHAWSCATRCMQRLNAQGFGAKRGGRRRGFPPNRKSYKKFNLLRVESAGKIRVGFKIDTDFFFITFSIRRETSSSSSSFVPKPCA